MQHTVIFSSLCKWKHQKWLFLLLKGTQYARLEYGGTQYAMGDVSTNVRPCQKSRGNECLWERMSGIRVGVTLMYHASTKNILNIYTFFPLSI